MSVYFDHRLFRSNINRCMKWKGIVHNILIVYTIIFSTDFLDKQLGSDINTEPSSKK